MQCALLTANTVRMVFLLIVVRSPVRSLCTQRTLRKYHYLGMFNVARTAHLNRMYMQLMRRVAVFTTIYSALLLTECVVRPLYALDCASPAARRPKASVQQINLINKQGAYYSAETG